MRKSSRILLRLSVLYIVVLHFGICKAQDAGLVNLAQLEQRLEVGGDTIFILNFWATWCVPCVEEIPHFLNFSKRKNTIPTKVLFISLDSPSKLDSVVSPFVAEHQMLDETNEVYILNERNQQKYIDQIDTSWSGAIPASLFVTDNGRRRLFKEQSFNLNTLKTTWQSFRDGKDD